MRQRLSGTSFQGWKTCIAEGKPLTLEIADEIAAFKPLVGVAGNCDNYDLRYTHPVHRFFECEGFKVLMIHVGG
jgi:predicted phosphodiesterase